MLVTIQRIVFDHFKQKVLPLCSSSLLEMQAGSSCLRHNFQGMNGTKKSQILENIDQETLNELVDHAKDFALAKGIVMRHPDLPRDVAVPLPFCLVPSKYPRDWFNTAQELQSIMNLVLLKVSFDRKFLEESLASTVEADEFASQLYRMYETVEEEKSEGDEQLCLGLIRSDYLLNCDTSGSVTGLKQVESNVIAASFGGMAPRVRDLHAYTLSKLGQHDCNSKLPVNNSTYDLAKGLTAAWEAYGNTKAAILVVIEEALTNVYDQKALEYVVFDINSSIKLLRHTFEELRHIISLKDKALFLNDEVEVAVVYYRTGYVPDQFQPKDWKTRLILEKSKAIKCPSIGMQLAGTKRVQMQLTKPGVLEKFVAPDVAEKLRKLFVNMYSLEKGEEGDRAILLGIKNYEKFVLKPEREGGGNNLYGSDIKDKLESISTSDERNAYILMERIFPPFHLNCIISYNVIPKVQNIACELGIYGVILGNQKGTLVNNYAGHLIRSKFSSSNETGIVAGFGALDSPYLE